MSIIKQQRFSTEDFLKNKRAKEGFWGKGMFLKIKSIKNNQQKSRFGFVVGSNVSKKAVERNLIKRRLRVIVGDNLDKIRKGFDIVVITSPVIVGKKYVDIKKDLIDLLKQLKLLAND